MSDLISRALLSGLGLASLTKDAIQKTVEDLVNQSKISEDEGRRIMHDLQKRSADAQKHLQDSIDSGVHEVFQRLNLPSIISDRLKGKAPAHKKSPKHKTMPSHQKATATHKASAMHKTSSPAHKSSSPAHKTSSPAHKTHAVAKPAKKGSNRVVSSKMAKAKKPAKR